MMRMILRDKRRPNFLNRINQCEEAQIMGFGSIGMPELLIILVVVLLLFGAKRLPELARGLGKGIREFKDATKNVEKEFKELEESEEEKKG
jgi:sec-independent protein translocase protein TatA